MDQSRHKSLLSYKTADEIGLVHIVNALRNIVWEK
jgi:hypothetical protein